MASLIRFSPSSDIRRMQREIDRMFNDFLPLANGDSSEGETAVWAPRVDLAETTEAYLITVDLPGIDKKDVAINFHDGTISISGERKTETSDEGKNYVRVERSTGNFYRSFSIPNAVQADKIEAKYSDGVLQIVVPKAEEVKPHRIKIG